ncbi:stabilizer of axonemal microtubules 2 isoform X2 [Clupea harengus]|nr:stabilizer of axonemal microtubules 2 isoform X2 [Clupea harengus]
MTFMTTSRFDYVPHCIVSRAPRAQPAYVPPEGSMKMTSTYTADFLPHAVQFHRVHKVQEYHPTTAKMDGLSTYKEDFCTWPPQRRQPHRLTDNLTLESGKFCGISTFKDDFRPNIGIATRKPFRPPLDSVEQRETFKSATNYRQQYVPHPVEALQRPSSAPVRGASAQHMQYQNQATEGAPVFQGTTEFREKYQPWRPEPRQQRQVDEYVPPTSHMTFHTTSRDDFVRHECTPPPRPVRPIIQAWADEKPAHRGKHGVQSAKPTTTYSSQFTPKTAPRPVCNRSKLAQKPCSDAQQPVEGAGGHQPGLSANAHGPPCPASLANPPGFQDTSMTHRGHRLYRTISDGETGTAKSHAAKEVTTVNGNQSPRGHIVSRKILAADGRGRGQH